MNRAPVNTGAFLFLYQSLPAGVISLLLRILRPMTVRVLLFASYADALGRNELTLELGAGSVVADVVSRVREMAGGRVLPPSPLLALNASYATSSTIVKSGDEVAIIPPVAGG